MSDTKTVNDYGWDNPEAVCSHTYLLPALIRLFRQLGAKHVLDLGCGNGAMTRALAREGFDLIGCDADENGIALARRIPSTARFEVLGVYDDPQKLGNGNFDVVISAEVVEHLFLPRQLPRFAKPLLKTGGFLIVTTPYHGYLKNLALSLLGKWDSHHSPLWDGGHIKFWSRSTLGTLLEQEGFEVKEFKGVGRFPLLWKSMIVTAQKR